MTRVLVIALSVFTVLVSGNNASAKDPLTGHNRVGIFSDDLIPVEKDGEQFHIRPDGFRVYEESYDRVFPFNEGVATVVKEGKYFHIYPDGSRVYEESYDWVSAFRKGVAIVKEGGSISLIHITGLPLEAIRRR